MDEKKLSAEELDQVNGGSSFTVNMLCTSCEKLITVPMGKFAEKDFVCDECKKKKKGKLTDVGDKNDINRAFA